MGEIYSFFIQISPKIMNLWAKSNAKWVDFAQNAC